MTIGDSLSYYLYCMTGNCPNVAVLSYFATVDDTACCVITLLLESLSSIGLRVVSLALSAINLASSSLPEKAVHELHHELHHAASGQTSTEVDKH